MMMMMVNWDKETGERLKEFPGLENELREAVRMRMAAAEMESQAKAAKDEANETLRTLITVLGVKRVGVTEGTVSIKSGSRVSYRMDVVKEALLGAGVQIGVIEQAVESGKQITQFESVEWRWKHEKK